MEIDNRQYRHEIKYNIDKLQFEEIKTRLAFLLKKDKNVNEKGNYFIRSLYFDDYKNTSFHQVLDGVSKRVKYRIRYYNFDTTYICLEKKYKINNMVNKTYCIVTKEQVEKLIDRKT